MKYVFIHGLGQTEKSWDSMISQFIRAEIERPNLSVLLKSQSATYENLYKCFTEYCDKFNEPLNLCGLSLGGILALNYTIEYPQKVNSFVLIGTQYKMPKGLLKLQNVVFRFMPNSLFNDMGFSKNDFIRLTNSMASLDFSKCLSGVNCKSLIVCGVKDGANKKSSVSLSTQLKNSKLVFIENASHEVNVENPSALIEKINNFYDDMEYHR